MTIAGLALRNAVHQALATDPTLTALLGGAKVYAEPPKAAEFPYVTIGPAVTLEDGGTENHNLAVHGWSRRGGHREAHMIAGALLQALDDAPLALDGQRLVNLKFAVADVRNEDDGHTYHALVRFRAMTEPDAMA